MLEILSSLEFAVSIHLPVPLPSLNKRKVQIQDTRPVKPELALVYMEYLLTHPKNRECLLSAPQRKLRQLLKALEVSKVTFCPENRGL